MIEPTVGRIVWYRPNGADHSVYDLGQALGAMVAFVHNPRLVNLNVTDASGITHARLNVTLLQEGDLKPDSQPYCEWMPFQKGQAAKTEAAEAKLAGDAA